MMQVLLLLQFAKKDEAMLISEEIKAIATAIIEIPLSEGISKSIS